mmetsp:Transcript_26429/g.55812  ORF Transcript_26429/g.55812 Transcript_26429/m.55812 type:complete len:215 (+) Transcript_26429:419-1063(+)
MTRRFPSIAHILSGMRTKEVRGYAVMFVGAGEAEATVEFGGEFWVGMRASAGRGLRGTVWVNCGYIALSFDSCRWRICNCLVLLHGMTRVSKRFHPRHTTIGIIIQFQMRHTSLRLNLRLYLPRNLKRMVAALIVTGLQWRHWQYCHPLSALILRRGSSRHGMTRFQRSLYRCGRLTRAAYAFATGTACQSGRCAGHPIVKVVFVVVIVFPRLI